jgi:hypothetical protein
LHIIALSCAVSASCAIQSGLRWEANNSLGVEYCGGRKNDRL